MTHGPIPADRAPARLLTGHVTHARLKPVTHRFDYRVFYVSVDLARLAQVRRWWFGIDRWAPLALVTSDFGPRDGRSLDVWMRGLLVDAGIPADGEIWLQTLPRLFGYAFNPVSFWFCHDRSGALRALYADVRNTFGAHHGYLLSAPGHAPIVNDTVLTCRKTFHVSPFCHVKGQYAFHVRRDGDRTAVAIDYGDGDGPLLCTSLMLRSGRFTGALVLKALAEQPLGIVGVMTRIYWQALRLWLKRTPFYGAHPRTDAADATSCPSDSHSKLLDDETPS
ncbi:DUF1365 domain-containing protein [Trinickia dinghuensis]|uniref:DUF1365 domain-containing protein n=1 Tax=Trinickia dinghuensis TaxID=2291023 RepID=A0A3D8JT67_9BURK|nr:DUF1365 domain-containing protein [Trinickia dinghuensis]RDU96323.1 DUF1365 domain-containing protein [Trinickia dinghuensis]